MLVMRHKVWPDDVGAVQPPAHAYFYDGHVYCFIGKIPECHGCGQFEEGRVQGLEERAFPGYEVDYVFLRDGLAVDSDAFAEVEQVGRGVEPGAIACLLENGGQRVRA